MRHKGIEIRDNMNPNLPILTVGGSKHRLVAVVCCEEIVLFMINDFSINVIRASKK